MSAETLNAAPADDVLPWMPLWVGDFLVEIMALNQEQIGALTLLMCAYWVNRGPLPDDDDHLASITRSAPAQWKKLKPRLLRHFTVEAGHWRNSRIDRHLSDAHARQEKAKTRAHAGARARWGGPKTDCTKDASSIPAALPVHCPSPSPSPPPGQQRDVAALKGSNVALLRNAPTPKRAGTTGQGQSPPSRRPVNPRLRTNRKSNSRFEGEGNPRPQRVRHRRR